MLNGVTEDGDDKKLTERTLFKTKIKLCSKQDGLSVSHKRSTLFGRKTIFKALDQFFFNLFFIQTNCPKRYAKGD